MDGTYTAVIDRIIDGETAVFLIEDDGEVVDEHNHPEKDLPPKVDEGAVCEVTFRNEEIVEIDYLQENTEARRQASQDRFDKLSERLSDS